MRKVVVRGPALSQSGYGEHTRFVLRSLRSRPELFDVYLFNTPWGATSWVWEDNEERRWIDGVLQKTIEYGQRGGQFDVSLQVTIPNEWEKMAPINIGVTAGIETTKIAPVWVEKSMQMDKIIVVSEHAKHGFENTEYQAENKQTGEQFIAKVTCPIDVVGYPVKEIVPEKLDIDLKDDFNFLAIGTWIIRKNLENTIKWFVEEFYDQEIGLVVKTSLAKNCLRDREAAHIRLKSLLDEYKDRKCSIYMLHGDMTEQEITGLYQHPKIKAFISIAHGEGFGLPMFEAAYNALPVVSPAWGGQCDFLYMPVKNKSGKTKNTPMFTMVPYDIKPIQKEAHWEGVLQTDSQWCYAKEWAYKKSLRSVVKEYGSVKSKAKKLQKYIKNNFSEEVQYLKIAEIVHGDKIANVEIEDIPKVSIITSVFKSDEYIEQLMEDVTRQTIFKDSCEWIILNANEKGHDFEEEVILKYVEKYPNNIIYKRLKKDPGIYETWNTAIKMSTGEFITNVNCDDRRAPWGFEAQAKLLVSEPEIDLVYNDSYVVHEPNVMWEDVKTGTQRYNFDQFSKEAMVRGNLPHNNPMWRKSVHKKNGYFNQQYKSAADWSFWLRCAFAGSEFKKHPEVLGVYYFNPEGVSTNPENDSWKQQEEKEVFMEYHKKMQEEKSPEIIL